MKIIICEPCKRLDGKIIETNRIMRVKGQSYLNMDVCPEHTEQINKMTTVEYVRYVYRVQGVELKGTDDEIKLKYLRN